MLTPVDLQQKKFTHGMGYARKDVDAFFDIVVLSYTELYKSNADLTNQVKTLTDSLVHYRTTESKLQKSLMLAEKNAEESTKNATDKARLIENDAKIKANNIVQEAREELERIEGSIDGIKQQYKDYVCAFKALMEAHMNYLAQNPINEEMGLNFDDVLSEGSSNASYSQSTQSAAMNSFMNSYDGTGAIKAAMTPVRVAQPWVIQHLAVPVAEVLQVIRLYTQRILAVSHLLIHLETNNIFYTNGECLYV